MRTIIQVALLLGLSIPSVSAADDLVDADLSINQIMQQAHFPRRSALYRRVIDGKATDKEQQRLLALYQALAAQVPRKGAAESWKKLTGEIVASVEAVIRGDDQATTRLATAVNCQNCHSAHKPVYEADGTIVVDADSFASAPPPEWVKLANVSKDKTILTFYHWESKLKISFRDEKVEQDGKVREVQIPIQTQVRELTSFKLPMQYLRVLDVEGKEITGDKIWERLKSGEMVYLNRDSKTIDAAYLKLLARDATILVPTVLPLPDDVKPDGQPK